MFLIFSGEDIHSIHDLVFWVSEHQGDEFRNFIERLESRAEDGTPSSGPGSLEDALCEWASMRMQTLWRTVDGICSAYAHALERV